VENAATQPFYALDRNPARRRRRVLKENSDGPQVGLRFGATGEAGRQQGNAASGEKTGHPGEI
jgi:hypothetical protein